jgi:tetratricopeptide (TPR) repeat protein
MPLNVRRFSTSVFLVFVGFITAINAQIQAVNSPSAIPPAVTPIKTQTAAEIMRERISKAKAFIAVRNYNAAIYELENIRRETSDSSVHAVTNILLMNSYLEQGNYKKAQDLLAEAYKNFKANNANGSMFYSAVAGQAVKGARNQIERYRLLGLSVSDRNLPLEAVNDIEKMRETLELVVAQTKEAGADKAKATVVMPLLEEAMAAPSSLGRDDYAQAGDEEWTYGRDRELAKRCDQRNRRHRRPARYWTGCQSSDSVASDEYRRGNAGRSSAGEPANKHSRHECSRESDKACGTAAAKVADRRSQ